MRLTPRYGSSPIITLDGSPADILTPVTRQRRRLADALASFTENSGRSRADAQAGRTEWSGGLA